MTDEGAGTEEGMRPVARQSLAEELARRLGERIQSGRFAPGDRLPSIAGMARQFGVGSPTVREALRKLETAGAVEIRHGAGVFVRRPDAALLVTTPAYGRTASRKVLVDLLDARIAIEVRTVALAAQHATPEQVDGLRAVLARAEPVLDDPAALARVNRDFHAAVAEASGNTVLRQLLDVLSSLFREEQRMVYDIHGACAGDHDDHRRILDALAQGDAELAAARMHAHLAGVRDVLRRSEPDAAPGVQPAPRAAA